MGIFRRISTYLSAAIMGGADEVSGHWNGKHAPARKSSRNERIERIYRKKGFKPFIFNVHGSEVTYWGATANSALRHKRTINSSEDE
jgi:hypothetical protein